MTELANLKVQSFYLPQVKALRTFPDSPQGTPIQGSAPSADLQTWIKKAKAYYEAVISGDPGTPKPSAQDWANFLDEWKFAQTQLQGGGGDATAGSDWNPPM